MKVMRMEIVKAHALTRLLKTLLDFHPKVLVRSLVSTEGKHILTLTRLCYNSSSWDRARLQWGYGKDRQGPA
jgi:hypothetical protein